VKKDLYILGAGFSWYAGLPLQREFTKNLLQTGDPHQVTLVQFLRSFINKTFDHNIKAASKYWPELEDIFTCIDLSANTGHTLGLTYDASHLRTVRRALISRMIRMLDDLYLEASREARPE